MKEETKIEFSGPVPDEVTIRQGSAGRVIENKAVIFAGSIAAPFEFFRFNEAWIKSQPHFLKVDTKKGKMVLYWDSDTDIESSVTGETSHTDMFKAFPFGKAMEPKSLAQFLKPKRRFFTDQAEFARLVSNLNNFTANVQKHLEKSQDTRGNKADAMPTLFDMVEVDQPEFEPENAEI